MRLRPSKICWPPPPPITNVMAIMDGGTGGGAGGPRPPTFLEGEVRPPHFSVENKRNIKKIK